MCGSLCDSSRTDSLAVIENRTLYEDPDDLRGCGFEAAQSEIGRWEGQVGAKIGLSGQEDGDQGAGQGPGSISVATRRENPSWNAAVFEAVYEHPCRFRPAVATPVSARAQAPGHSGAERVLGSHLGRGLRAWGGFSLLCSGF